MSLYFYLCTLLFRISFLLIYEDQHDIINIATDNPTINLSSIYKDIRSTDPVIRLAIQTKIRDLPLIQLDNLLRQWIGHALRQTQRWPIHRLLRCIDIIIQSIDQNEKHVLRLPSLHKSIQQVLVVTHTSPSDVTAQAFLPCFTKLFERFSRLLPRKECQSAVGNLIKWCMESEKSIRLICLRGLLKPCFQKTLVQCDAYWLLTQQLHTIQTERDELTLVSRLLEQLIKYGRDAPIGKHAHTQLVNFSNAAHFHILVGVWENVSKTYQEQPLDIRPIHSLTTIVNICCHVSEKAVERISERKSIEKWQPLMYQAMRDFLIQSSALKQSLYGQMSEAEQSKETPWPKPEPSSKYKNETDISASLLSRILQCNSRVFPASQKIKTPLAINQCVLAIIQCLTVYISWPITPEDISQVGQENWTTNLYIDAETRAFCCVDAGLLLLYEPLFVILLDGLIQIVPHIPTHQVAQISRSIAVCIQAIWTSLLRSNRESPQISSRLEKLTIFLLHYNNAIDQFANASSSLQPLIWRPTLDQAKQCLMAMTSQKPTEWAPNVIDKAKRALISLEKATHHARACERLVSEDALSLVSPELVPDESRTGASTDSLTIYALLVRFISSLVNKTAYVRIRLREEQTLMPMIFHLLTIGVQEREKSISQRKEWNRLLFWSIDVIRAFKFDHVSLRAWITWTDQKLAKMNISTATATYKPSLCTILKLILTPFQQTSIYPSMDIWSSDEEVIITAIFLMDQLIVLPDFGKQIMETPGFLECLSKLLITVCCPVTGRSRRMAIDEIVNPDLMEYKSSEYTTELPKSIDRHGISSPYIQVLQKTITRLLTTKENIMVILNQYLLTSFFNPMLRTMSTQGTYWQDFFSEQIYERIYDDLQRIFLFTADDNNAIILHESTAIAISYACMDPSHWGLLSEEHSGGILYTNSVLGVICHMLVYDLEHTQTDYAMERYIIGRKVAAAQVLETMGTKAAQFWYRSPFQWPGKRDIETNTTSTPVLFITDDSDELVESTSDVLIPQSSSFTALLSNIYSESTVKPIRLHDVSCSGLRLLFSLLSRLKTRPTLSDAALLPQSISWPDVIELLKLADRFGCYDALYVCEQWILDQVKHRVVTNECLEGCVMLFRACRDPTANDGGITSNVWPFQQVVQICVQGLISHCVRMVSLKSFKSMVEDNDSDELSAFCDSIVITLKFGVIPRDDTVK
ncbi:hypothetical protein J3Q64DRAFT_1700448 [Phycomyces blakesleeanus]|uniref:BTB domain-containing protein n=2 Tax=Phycomyces blakesleeanus TaxID=4837 RepID=A0A162U6P2_PHYB8|nr:hypothetical protein PHYBLDRAFT_65297 [Phycomyces blakesleeanus NRRL 1555(-)]OAD72783.1 hypothetical protein PHYBLDRAFT_65297 [Phycomyces blakesleeanus NRRL 1555(-)]|eukprot:XP_018290823.1 hypothetical protein PHYBLDRAFT_65297 [Phycomyces blakesleeanus NRRL 1555(-)]